MNLNQLITRLFDNWKVVKQKSHFHQKIIGIKEWDIVFVRMGQNIGYEHK